MSPSGSQVGLFQGGAIAGRDRALSLELRRYVYCYLKIFGSRTEDKCSIFFSLFVPGSFLAAFWNSFFQETCKVASVLGKTAANLVHISVVLLIFICIGKLLNNAKSVLSDISNCMFLLSTTGGYVNKSHWNIILRSSKCFIF